MNGQRGMTILSTIGLIFILLLVISVPYGTCLAQATRPRRVSEEMRFAGEYSNLKPEQRKLIDDWIKDYNRLTSQKVAPQTVYNESSLSVRTTFEAVTHALLNTQVTTKWGRPSGTALDLINTLQTIRGQVPGARGDLQFRIYVILKPNAVQILESSREFSRVADNMLYHAGSPINYRQKGMPSIQFSISEDHQQAEVDVDYRQSVFPQGLFNGYQVIANSDVRAGRNYDRHAGRWPGLGNWWRAFFSLSGVSSKYSDRVDTGKAASAAIPNVPPAGKGKLEEAVNDFFTIWLVGGDTNQALSYFSDRAFTCLSPYEEDGKTLNNPVSVVARVLGAMRAANSKFGRVTALKDVMSAVQVNDSRVEPLPHAQAGQFTLFRIPEDTIMKYECAYREGAQGTVADSAKSTRLVEYYASIFEFKLPQGRSPTTALVWAWETGFWRIVNCLEEPNAAPLSVPDTRPRTPIAPADPRPPADDSFVKATQDFFTNWLVKKNYEATMSYFSSACYPCVNLEFDEVSKVAQTPKELAQYIRSGVTAVGVAVGRVERLDEVLEVFYPANRNVRVLSHPQENAYVIVGMPDHLADQLACNRRISGELHDGPMFYGNHMGTVFQLRVQGGNPAVLALIWKKEKGQWKIASYIIETP